MFINLFHMSSKNTFNSLLKKLREKETPPLVTISLYIVITFVSLFILFLSSFSLNQAKALNILDSEISQIRSECTEPYDKEDGKFKIKVTNPEANVMTVSVSWKTFFLIADSYTYSFIPTKICSN